MQGPGREGMDELKNLLVAVVLVVIVGYFIWRTIPPADRPSFGGPSGADSTSSVTVLPTPSPSGSTGG